MADTKISALPSKASTVSADTIVIVDSVGGATKRSTTGGLPVSTPQATALSAKEDVANKSTDVDADQASDTKYPSVKSVYDFVGDSIAALPTPITDHGDLSGLGDDDHTQYHNDTRGDVRYYTKELSDNRYAIKHPEIETMLFDDFDGALKLSAVSFSGGQLNQGIAGIGNSRNVGVSRLRVNAVNGYIILTAANNSVIFGTADWYASTCVYFNALATVGSQEFTYRFGFGDTINIGEPLEGAYLEYDPAISLNWIMVTSDTTRTRTITSVPVVSGKFTLLEVVVNSAATSVEYFVNKVSVGTVTTNIPTTPTGYMTQLTKSLGSGIYDVFLDFVLYKGRFTAGERFVP